MMIAMNKNFVILDLLHHSIWLIKWIFLAYFLPNFSTICSLMLSKFGKKSIQKSLIFSIKVNDARGLFCLLCFSCLQAELEFEASQVRLENIQLMHSALKMSEYDGYDIIIVSSTTQEEADYQQNKIEKAFSGTTKKNGQTPIILSVVDSTEGGQLIGSIYTWLKAEDKMKAMKILSKEDSILDRVRSQQLKVAFYHNGGKGERCSPLTQSLGNSRGAQKLVGSIKNALGEEVQLEVLLGVVLQCSSFAKTNCGTHLDTFWTSQIAFGSLPHDCLQRSNFAMDKFLVVFNKDNLIPQNIADFGTAALSSEGQMTAFYGNKRFAERKGDQYIVDLPKIEKELFSKGDFFAYDFGSFSTSFEMWDLLVKYWTMKGAFAYLDPNARSPIKRDIDPHFIQPLIRLLHGIHFISNRNYLDSLLPEPSQLTTLESLHQAARRFDEILKIEMPATYQYIWEEIFSEKEMKKRTEAMTCMYEVMEFYLLYRQRKTFEDLTCIFGFINLGEETQWFRYRRPIDIMNEKFEMLTDLLGKKIEIQLDGSLKYFSVDQPTLHRCYESRRMRGIFNDGMVNFKVEGKTISLDFNEIQKGKMVEGVFIQNSIIQNSHLMRGSSVIDSVLNCVVGKVIAKESYVESTSVPLLESFRSIVHEVANGDPIMADREVISDVYRTKVQPPYHGRMRAPIGYDPKGTLPDEATRYFFERSNLRFLGINKYGDDTAKTEDGRFTFDEIRRIEPQRISDLEFREARHSQVRKHIFSKMAED